MSQPAFLYADYLATATVTATDTDTGYSAADVLESCEDLTWKPANQTGSKSLTIDLGATLLIGAVALVGDFLNGVTLEVRGSTDNFVASDVELSAAAAIATATFVSTWRSWSNGNYRYLRLVFSGMGASFRISHVAACRFDLLPYPEDGHDPDIIQAEGTHLVSVSGYYLGSNQQKTLRPLQLAFGEVTDAEFAVFQRWSDACVKTMQGFFYVPDTAETECFFGWLDPKYKFSAPMKNGMRKMAAIAFNSRVA